MVIRVLLVDDDVELLDVARNLLQQEEPDFEIEVSSSIKDVLAILEKEEFSVIISDYLMPDSSGLEILEALRTAGDSTAFVIWTRYSNEEIVIKSLNLGADYYILKSKDYRNQFSAIKDIILNLSKKKSVFKPPMIRQENASKFIHQLSHDIAGIAHNIMGYTTLLGEENNPDYINGIGRLVMKLSNRVKTAVTEIDNGKINE
ncbi:MAG: response regulator [Candidatus Thorarchaeota archaeon]